MSTFSTVQPRTGTVLVESNPGPKPPTWWMAAMTTLTCVLPIALVVAYWIGRIKCDRVITLTVWAYVLASVLALALFAVANRSASSAD